MKTCGTCKWGRFEWTNHKPPRIKANCLGWCAYPNSKLVIPLAFVLIDVPTIQVRPECTNCPTWEALTPERGL